MLAEDVRHPERQPMSSKGGRTKDKKRDKEVGMEIHPEKGVLKKREVSKHQETLTSESVASLGTSEDNITRRKNK